MGDIKLPDNYTVVDLETTGLSPQSDKIIEIGAVKVKNSIMTSSFDMFIRINEHLPKEITSVTGITDSDLEAGYKLKNVLPLFKRFIGSDPLVGHNIEDFDLHNKIRKGGSLYGKKEYSVRVKTLS